MGLDGSLAESCGRRSVESINWKSVIEGYSPGKRNLPMERLIKEGVFELHKDEEDAKMESPWIAQGKSLWMVRDFANNISFNFTYMGMIAYFKEISHVADFVEYLKSF